MKMESSRRSAAAAATNPRGPKKARLIAESPPPTNGGVISASSLSAADRNRPFRPREVRPYQLEQQQQEQQELVEQYKMALAELTFNSKPIITNLTIIAGENLQAAKGIANTICSNIIEVPSEQKLPSLYLLDSIVKNIGRDYIKHFAAKLPEVFCKAYKQVEPSIHQGMRHLFGTWKGVFPAAPLQAIEKELGFAAINNGSSSTVSKPDSQTQRPAHSIHVNPKYLEARQRLQQSNRAKEMSSDSTGSRSTSADDSEKLDKTAATGRQWTELPAKIQAVQRYQRDILKEPVRGKDSLSVYGDHEFTSDLPRTADLRTRRSSEKMADRVPDKVWSGPGRDASETAVDKRNGFDSNHAYGNYHAYRSSEAALQIPPTKGISSRGEVTSGSWKNSEEEEYMWDDMHSRFTDRGWTDSSLKSNWSRDAMEKTENLQRGKYIPSGTEVSDAMHKVGNFSTLGSSGGEARVSSLREVGERFSHSRGQKDVGLRFQRENSPDSLSSGQSALTHRGSSLWPSQESQPLSNLNHLGMVSRSSGQPEGRLTAFGGGLSKEFSLSKAKTGLSSQPAISVSVMASAQPPMHQRPYSPQSLETHLHQRSQGSVDNDYLQNLPFPQMSQKPYLQTSHQNIQQPHMRLNFLPSLSKSSQHTQSSSQSQPLVPSQKHPLQPLPFSTSQSSEYSTSGHSDPSTEPGNVLAALMKSGLIGTTSTASTFQPPLPSGPPPAQLATTSSNLMTPISVSAPSSHGNASSFPGALPPLPPGPPPPPSLVGTSSQTSGTSAVPNPLSTLLNNLVAKGLITSSAPEVPTVTAVPHLLQHKDVEVPAVTSMPVDSNPASVTAPSASSAPEFSLPEKCAGPPQAPKVESKGKVGTEFRPEIMREFHPEVISDLFDDLPHQCSICGLRFNLLEQLGGHMDWHDSRKSELDTDDQISRRWYSVLGDWIDRSVGPSFGPMPTISIKDEITQVDESEPMVPADESQTICALCGEIFEDVYSVEKDEWMYKGTIYMSIPSVEGHIGNTDDDGVRGPVVHATCASRSSLAELEEDEDF
ncbi:hypothetical protein QJS04_geneDACA010081 [Acorus gramineus]|uniref:CID domain-containing protein n=1 Tax=Acorus gramineus TaxID=55184 RepID=A0AAV9BJC0_ACOGR|nr:hypothetical protein QJS04_geneDACA010081 [Acorus gramineus]